MTAADTRRLQRFGFHLVGLRSGEKAPAGGGGWQRRVVPPDRACALPPGANVGVMGGRPLRPGCNLVVLDVDVKRGKAGPESLARVQADHGKLPLTARATTPSGGEHYYLAVPDGIPLGGVVNVFGQLGYPGIDLIGAGLYVVAPPSTLADGTGYDWLYRPDEAGVGIAAAPPWLVSWLRLAGRPAAGPAPRRAREANGEPTTAVLPAAGPRTLRKIPSSDCESLLADIVRRYPVGSEVSRNPQMSKAVASLTTKGVPAPAVREIVSSWLRHYEGAYSTPLDRCMVELDRCQNSLRKKIESGGFTLAGADHAATQSTLQLTADQDAFLAALPACPFLTMVEKDDDSPAGGWDVNEEQENPPRLPRLSTREKQLAECLVRLVAYKLSRGEVDDDEFLTTNQQMMDLMAARFGVVFKSAANEFGSKAFRRLKQALIRKQWKGRTCEALKVELVEVVSEGRPGAPSRYRMTGLSGAFRPAEGSGERGAPNSLRAF